MLEDVGTGKVQLPNFQREWKWDDERIKALIATVTQGYPLGVIMTLSTGGQPQFQPRSLAGVELHAEVVPDDLLLDGQQRTTSLFQALCRNEPVETADARGRPLRRWYYINMEAAVSEGIDREDAIVSVPEDRVLRDDFARKIRLDLSSGRQEREYGHFPLNLVFNTEGRAHWRKLYCQQTDNWALWDKFEACVLKQVDQFLVPTISLPANTAKEAVCSVFERVNTGGVVLNVFELLTATYAGDRAYLEETGKDFDLAAGWREIRTSLCQEHPMLGVADDFGQDGLTSSDFLQAVALVYTYNRKLQRRASAVACKRKDLLNLPLADFRDLAPKLTEAFAWAGSFLARQCIFNAHDVPYRTQLVPLAAIRALLAQEDAWTSRAEGQITQWYWAGVLGEMYGGAIESRFSRDVEQVLAWVTSASAPVPDTIAEANFHEQRLATLKTRNSAAYKGIYALLIKQGAVDWYYAAEPIGREAVVGRGVDIRQVFPKAWFQKRYGQDPRMASIVNKTPISYQAALWVSGAPSRFLPILAMEAGMKPVWFDDVIASHLIDPRHLYDDDFEAFYSDRSTRLIKLIEEAMGRPVLRIADAEELDTTLEEKM
ncbi:DUF262 domain-containing protein [Kitasatospora sp. NPDC087271]|uniref:GmrSD restriction endonuclease domain-containing protein n=1 Tax=Kitasatospora sp. NPDC087271 TaxID=3364067 RepID=UPI003818462F